MVAFASDWRIFDKQTAALLRPALIVLRYKQVMGTADRPEMPHGITLKQMLATVVRAEEDAIGTTAEPPTRLTAE